MRKQSTDLWNRFWRDKDGQIAIWQPPNVPLIVWAIFMIMSKVYSAGKLHDVSVFISTASIFTWAYLEIVSGRSYFRRLLGLIVLLSIVVAFFR